MPVGKIRVRESRKTVQFPSSMILPRLPSESNFMRDCNPTEAKSLHLVLFCDVDRFAEKAKDEKIIRTARKASMILI